MNGGSSHHYFWLFPCEISYHILFISEGNFAQGGKTFGNDLRRLSETPSRKTLVERHISKKTLGRSRALILILSWIVYMSLMQTRSIPLPIYYREQICLQFAVCMKWMFPLWHTFLRWGLIRISSCWRCIKILNRSKISVCPQEFPVGHYTIRGRIIYNNFCQSYWRQPCMRTLQR